MFSSNQPLKSALKKTSAFENSPEQASTKRPKASTVAAALLSVKSPRDEGKSSVSKTSSTQVSSPKEGRVALPWAPRNAIIVLGTCHSVAAAVVLRQSRLKLKFTTKHHAGCVNTVAICDRYIATAGTDERVFLYSSKQRGHICTELGSLTPPAEVRCLCFPTQQHLACGCSDGTLMVYRTRDWECAFMLKVHGKPLEVMAFHPASGRIAVTVGLDRFMTALDMESGRIVTKQKLPANLVTGGIPHGAFFNQSGSLVFIVLPFEVLVYDTLSMLLVHRISAAEKVPSEEIHGVCVIGDDLLIAGVECAVLRAARLDLESIKRQVQERVAQSEKASRPSLASLAKPTLNDDDLDEEDEEEEEDDEDEYDEERAGKKRGRAETRDERKAQRIAFENSVAGAAPADSTHSPDEAITVPYLTSSKKAEQKKKEQAARAKKESDVRGARQAELAAIPTSTFGDMVLTAVVPPEVQAAEAHRPSQEKRRHPTAHAARIRSVTLLQQAPLPGATASTSHFIVPSRRNNHIDSRVPVIISGDTEGCMIAWKVSYQGDAVTLDYIASANCGGRITSMASMLMEQ